MPSGLVSRSHDQLVKMDSTQAAAKYLGGQSLVGEVSGAQRPAHRRTAESAALAVGKMPAVPAAEIRTVPAVLVPCTVSPVGE